MTSTATKSMAGLFSALALGAALTTASPDAEAYGYGGYYYRGGVPCQAIDAYGYTYNTICQTPPTPPVYQPYYPSPAYNYYNNIVPAVPFILHQIFRHGGHHHHGGHHYHGGHHHGGGHHHHHR